MASIDDDDDDAREVDINGSREQLTPTQLI